MRYDDFSFKIFVSRYRKILLGNNSVYQKVSIIEKIFCMRRGYHEFVPKVFVSQYRKTSLETCFVVQKNSCIEKFSCIGGGHHGFVENFLSHRTEKHRKGSLLFHKNSGIEKKKFVSQCRRIS